MFCSDFSLETSDAELVVDRCVLCSLSVSCSLSPTTVSHPRYISSIVFPWLTFQTTCTRTQTSHTEIKGKRRTLMHRHSTFSCNVVYIFCLFSRLSINDANCNVGKRSLLIIAHLCSMSRMSAWNVCQNVDAKKSPERTSRERERETRKITQLCWSNRLSERTRRRNWDKRPVTAAAEIISMMMVSGQHLWHLSKGWVVSLA